jgi:hypothetical protein
MTVREPKVANHETVLVLGFRKVGEHLRSVVVVRIDVIKLVGATHAGEYSRMEKSMPGVNFLPSTLISILLGKVLMLMVNGWHST